MSAKGCTFERDEKAQQSAYFRAHHLESIGRAGADYRLTGDPLLNLAPDYREAARALFDAAPRIELHTHANHALSSQMCCANFLLPMADVTQGATLGRWIDHALGLEGAVPVPIEERAGAKWLIAFEWFPPTDYLHEANRKGERPRGAQSTSVDAAIRFEHGGRTHLLLIEWKYTERYPASRAAKERAGDPTRDRRYANIWKRPHGPIRADAPLTLQDFYLNPWYQLLRQQMLAYHVETDPLSDIDRASILHISPSGNRALHAVHGPFAALGDDLFDVFTSLLEPAFADRFRSVTTEAAFAPLATWPEAKWFAWLRDRYPSLCPGAGHTA